MRAIDYFLRYTINTRFFAIEYNGNTILNKVFYVINDVFYDDNDDRTSFYDYYF